ncbi:MAG: hypothetical protein ACI9WC_002575 [Arenicella sp.]|jgi:hypothetical protein
MKTHKKKLTAMRRCLQIVVIAITTLVSCHVSAIELNANNASDYVGRWGLHWWDTSVDGSNSSVSATLDNSSWAPNLTLGDDYYKPTRPTIIYFHGWQAGAMSDRKEENFTYTFDTETNNALQAWKDDGWNVGIFYWTPWADDSGEKLSVGSGTGGGEFASLLNFNVNAAEGKIWSSNGATGMRLKYYDPATADKTKWQVVTNSSSLADKEAYADMIKLKALSFTGPPWIDGKTTADIQNIKMHNGTPLSQAKSALKFILDHDSYYSYPALVGLRESTSSCKEFVRKVACNDHDESFSVDLAKTCPATTNGKPFWQEVFVPQVCEIPSVGVMASEMIRGVLDGRQTNSKVRFAGHSLGNQAAVQTATRMWWKSLVNTNMSTTALPKRLDLLDPYYSSQTKKYLKDYRPDNFNDSGQKANILRTTWGKAYSYVMSINKMYEDRFPSTGKFPVLYLDTSILSDFYGNGNPNTPLRDYAAYQKLNLNYLGNPVVHVTERHVDGRLYYFATKTNLGSQGANATSPPLNPILQKYPDTDAVDLPIFSSLNADSSDSTLRSMMTAGGAMVMTSGASSFTLADDAFTYTPDRSNVKKLIKTYGSDNARILSASQENILLVKGHRDALDFTNTLKISADNEIQELYVNGIQIDDSKMPNRSVWWYTDTIDNLDLNPGQNVIAMKVRNAGGPKGIFANLEFHRGSRQSLNESAVVSSSYQANWHTPRHDDTAWSEAFKQAAYGTGPWGTQFGAIENYDIDAAWVWGPANSDTAYIRWYVYVDDKGWRIKLADTPIWPANTTEAKQMVSTAHDLGNTISFTKETLDFTDSSYDTGNFLTGAKPFEAGDDERTDNFALIANTSITVIKAGWYTFGLKSDDGSVLSINSETIVSYDGYHSAALSPVGQKWLEQGVHQVEVVFFEGQGGAVLEVFYAQGNKSSFNSTDFSLLKGEQELLSEPPEPSNNPPGSCQSCH